MELSKMEQRYDALVAVIREGLTVTEAAESGSESAARANEPWSSVTPQGSRR
jgi:hypothetical protein